MPKDDLKVIESEDAEPEKLHGQPLHHNGHGLARFKPLRQGLVQTDSLWQTTTIEDDIRATSARKNR